MAEIAKLDVLAVMDAAIARNGHRGDNAGELRLQNEARAAVASLIAADKEYDDALANLSEINREIAEQGWVALEHGALRKAGDHFVRAMTRRYEAIEKVSP